MTDDEAEVLRLLESCRPAFLAWLRLHGLGRLQRGAGLTDRHGVTGPRGPVGANAVKGRVRTTEE